jgi:xanthine dehydrogenase accessory factor
MNDNEYIAGKILELLGKGSAAVLASIVSLEGSTPRHSGTKMVVGGDGHNYGTIGGSLLEATSIQEARSVLATGRSKFLEFSLSGKDSSSPGMICGGKALVLLDYLPPTTEIRDFFQTWQLAVRSGKDFCYLTHLKETGETVATIGHSILLADGQNTSTLSITGTEIETLQAACQHISLTYIMALNDTKVVIDPIRKMKTVYCFGAGHVAVPTIHMAALVGFRTVVLDDRAEFVNPERFPDAYNVRVIRDFNQAMEGLEIDADSYIVILTRGHQYDREVLEQALRTRAGYIGMISSRRKREAIYNTLMAQGVKKEDLEQVHSPIGIPLGGETPEEIAVSIVAELIKVRSDS